jgi:hypothetical protein
MQALSEKLQARLDTFNHRFGKKAEEDENRIWEVTNITKPEHERMKHTINGPVIANFIFSGDHEIEFVGYHKPKDTSGLLKERREKAIAEGKAAIEKLKQTEVVHDLESDSDIEELEFGESASQEVLANPSNRKVKKE